MTSRPARGFSLVELLVALTVCALLSGAIAAMAAPARAAFDSTPEALDLQQRGRTAGDVIARALRSAAPVIARGDDGIAGDAVPAVLLLEPDEGGSRFHALEVIALAGTGRGVLDEDQVSPSGSLTLRVEAPCPSASEVCGFSKGAIAVIADLDGRFDVFTVASASKPARSLISSRAFAARYPAGAQLIEVSADRYRLDPQADGSSALVRETAGGAVQPVVDDVSELSITAWRSAPGSPALEPLTAADVRDGPWASGGPEGEYDTDWRALRRVDITVRLGVRSAMLRGPAGRLFDRSGTAGQAPVRWVPDRTVHLSVSLRNPS